MIHLNQEATECINTGATFVMGFLITRKKSFLTRN